MNCFPATTTGRLAAQSATPAKAAAWHDMRFGLCLLALSSCYAPASEPAGENLADGLRYQVEYRVTPDPQAGGAHVELRLSQPARLLRELDMRSASEWISQLGGDGEISKSEDRVRWSPPSAGGTLRWFARINNRRNDGGHDSYIDSEWAVFRADDIIPPAATRTLKGATSETTLVFELPRDWSSATQYFGQDDRYNIRNDQRRFDRPTGWVALGRLGVRNDVVAGVRVKVAGPVGQSIRRMDIIAMLRWTLPEITRLLPDFPQRLTVISAGDPMWRGGLSAPMSLFLHSDRPMISENATSTLVHEVIHVGLGGSAAPGADWIVEGLAELYGLEALHRSGSISQRRYDSALNKLAERGREAGSLCADSSRGAVTARAVTLLHELDNEIRQGDKSSSSLDDVIRVLAASDRAITIAALRMAAESAIGAPSRTLSDASLEACH